MTPEMPLEINLPSWDVSKLLIYEQRQIGISIVFEGMYEMPKQASDWGTRMESKEAM